ncbi:hypothetical protein H5410_031643 [Solanum commersonii]|uniref:Uncharacterized protein n=1 Tax=Solanum commersonii TaxID=4109 RepID=A0A9J5YIW9_SOLCO|nr:hypothetical protein H5410_031643 [Solanum commersonii]
MPSIKRKIIVTTETKIKKNPRTKTGRKKKENLCSTLLEELASEVVSSSQVKLGVSSSQVDPRFSQEDLDILHEVKKMRMMMMIEKIKMNIISSTMEKSFNSFRNILWENDLEDFFRNSCLGKYLDLHMNNNARFQMSIVYELLKRRFTF